MSHISEIDYASAPEAIRAAHDEEVRVRGRMTNMKRTLLHSPVAHRIYAEWFTLRDLLHPVVPDRALWIFSMAISKASKAAIPVAFFRRALIGAGFAPEALELSDDEAVLDAFGTAIVRDSNAVPGAIWDKLKARFDEATLVNLVAFAGIMLATAVFNNVVGVEFDAELDGFAEPSSGAAA